MAALLLGTLACSAYPVIGEMTPDGGTGASTSGAGGTTGGSTTVSGTTGGSTGDAGATTGSSTSGQTIGTPSITAPGATDPNPCEVDFDFGNVTLGQAASETFTVSNTGNGVLDLVSIDPTLDPAFVFSGATPSPIQPGGQFQFTVSFTPTVVGEVTSSISVQTDGSNPNCPGSVGTGDSSLTVKLTGNGSSPCLQVQPSPLDFGNTEVNTTNQQSVTLTNWCTAPALGIVATIAGADANLFTIDNAPTSLAADAQATVDITYAPLALETQSVANVIFGDSDSAMATVNLFGEPVAVALTLAPNPCDFGSIPLEDIGMCCTTVTDQANVTVTINGVVDSDGISELNRNTYDDAGFMWGEFQETGSPLNLENVPIALAPGGSVEACFFFYPFSTQVVTEQATLQTNDPSGTNPVIELTGSGADAGPG
jgi:hypothetical protein